MWLQKDLDEPSKQLSESSSHELEMSDALECLRLCLASDAQAVASSERRSAVNTALISLAYSSLQGCFHGAGLAAVCLRSAAESLRSVASGEGLHESACAGKLHLALQAVSSAPGDCLGNDKARHASTTLLWVLVDVLFTAGDGNTSLADLSLSDACQVYGSTGMFANDLQSRGKRGISWSFRRHLALVLETLTTLLTAQAYATDSVSLVATFAEPITALCGIEARSADTNSDETRLGPHVCVAACHLLCGSELGHAVGRFLPTTAVQVAMALFSVI